jgi:hypothetical protein
MRRLLAARGSSAVALGVLLLLVAGGSFALGSAGSKTIHACVHRRGGGLYIAKKCAKHDKALSWNQVGPSGPAGVAGPSGPAGPGATYLVYNATGGTSNAPTTIGTLGPFTFTGVCTQTANTTDGLIGVTEPGAELDGIVVSGGNAASSSGALGPLDDGTFDHEATASPNAVTGSSDELVIPTSGTAFQLVQTLSVAGGSTNACHFSATATPTSPAGSVSAAARPAAGPGLAGRGLDGRTSGGLVVAGQRVR